MAQLYWACQFESSKDASGTGESRTTISMAANGRSTGCRPEEMAVVLPVMEGLPAAIVVEMVAAIEIRTAALMREQNAV